MTDQDHDAEDLRRVSRRYRELGAQEPPRALDDAILAAARREARSHPAPLVAPTGHRGWFGPLAAAAVLVLAVAVTLHMQGEQPDIADPAPVAKAPAAPRAAPAAAPPVAAQAEARLKLRAEPQLKSAAQERVAAATAAPAPAAVLSSRADQARESASGAAGALAPQAGPARAMAKRAAAQAQVPAETPERELERIAELRRQGRHDEADKALAEFRKHLPDYRIPEAILERVERR